MCITMMVIRLYGTHKIKKLVTEQNTQLQYIEAQYNRACIELRHHHFVEFYGHWVRALRVKEAL